MMKMIYLAPALEVEEMAIEQGYSLSTGFEVPGGEDNGGSDEWV